MKLHMHLAIPMQGDQMHENLEQNIKASLQIHSTLNLMYNYTLKGILSSSGT